MPKGNNEGGTRKRGMRADSLSRFLDDPAFIGKGMLVALDGSGARMLVSTTAFCKDGMVVLHLKTEEV